MRGPFQIMAYARLFPLTDAEFSSCFHDLSLSLVLAAAFSFYSSGDRSPGHPDGAELRCVFLEIPAGPLLSVISPFLSEPFFSFFLTFHFSNGRRETRQGVASP